MLLRFWVGLSPYVILEHVLQELEGPQQLFHPFEGEHFEV